VRWRQTWCGPAETRDAYRSGGKPDPLPRLANGEPLETPATIEDPDVLDEFRRLFKQQAA